MDYYNRPVHRTGIFGKYNPSDVDNTFSFWTGY